MLPTGFQVVLVDESADPILHNLFEFYLHDMAEWFEFDQTIAGNYTYDTNEVWQSGIDVHFLYHGKIPVGFGLVGSAEEWLPGKSAKDMDEFFVVRRHRRSRLGRAFATYLWESYRGPWLVRVLQNNLPAIAFWRSIIASHTDGHYREDKHKIKERHWSHFTFNSSEA